MIKLKVEKAIFSFEPGWIVLKLDDSEHFQKLHMNIHSGIKCVDVLAIDGQAVTYLIEHKDYFNPRTERPDSDKLVDDVCRKLIGALSMMPAAAAVAQDPFERSANQAGLKTARLELVLHCDVPDLPVWTEWSAIVKQKLAQKLRRRVSGISVTSQARPHSRWNVEGGNRAS